jgi:tetratricopeptide (TPR) repeat protein
MANPPLNPFLLAQFNVTAERLVAERAAALRIVDRLLRDTPRESWSTLIQNPDLRTAGALERIAVLVTQHLNRDARYSFALAELGVAIAESLSDHTYPAVVMAQLRAHALKDLGKVQRNLARNDRAIETFSRAIELLQDHLVLRQDLALVRLHLAYSYQEVDRFTEAFSIIRESKKVFAEHGDTRMVFIAGITEGALLQRLAKYREARETYMLLLLSGNPDSESTAALRKNIGLCCIELGDYTEAESNLAESIRLYMKELGHPIEVFRAQTGYGWLLIRMGQIEQAIEDLKPIRRAFLGQAMPEEAGICALEIIEGYLTRKKHDAAERLARQVIQEFSRAKLNKRAITALGYLSRALAAKKASVPLVHNVRAYILSLPDESGARVPEATYGFGGGDRNGDEIAERADDPLHRLLHDPTTARLTIARRGNHRDRSDKQTHHDHTTSDTTHTTSSFGQDSRCST